MCRCTLSFKSQLPPERLRAVLSSVCWGSAILHISLLEQQQPPRPEVPSLVVAALAGSASTLIALHGLPLVEPADHPELELATFTRLRALTLHQSQTSDSLHTLRLTQLPASWKTYS